MIGTRVDVWEITRALGTGSLGDAYEARDTEAGRRVVIRLIRPEIADEPARLAATLNAARAAMALQHPHIARILGVGPNYVVSEYVEGFPPETPLVDVKALEYGSQVLGAIQAAHDTGFVHGNLGISSLLVTPRGATVIDFGVAGAATAETSAVNRGDDLRAFGALLYEMLTGSPATTDRKSLPDKRLESIVARCLSPDLAKRYAAAADLARDLDVIRRWKSLRSRLLLSAAAVAVGLFGLLLFQLATTPHLEPQSVLIVADFTNRTSNPAFGTALRQALVFDVRQSPFFGVLDEEQIRQTLRTAGHPIDAPLTPTLARDVCRRSGAAATLESGIEPIGTSFLVTLQAVHCRTGRRLGRTRIEVSTSDEIVSSLGTVSADLRATLGEPSARTVPSPTTSIAALAAYARGELETLTKPDAAASIPHYQRAVGMDTTFAVAWLTLGLRYAATGDTVRANESITAAHERGANNGRDRLYVEAVFQQLQNDLPKQRAAWEQLARRYPTDPTAHINLAALYARIGDWRRAANEAIVAVRTGPRRIQAYSVASTILMELNRVDEAKAVLRQAIAIGFDIPAMHETLFYLESAGTDEAAIERERQWFDKRLRGAPQPLRTVANRAAALGQYARAFETYRETIARARKQPTPVPPQRYAEEQALVSALFEDCTRVDRGVSVLADAICGSAPAFTQIASAQSGPASGPAVFGRGMVLMKAGRVREAATLFDAMLARRTANWGPELPAAMVGRARAAVALGDTAAARQHYAMLLELWKGADPDVPLLVAARTELVRLK